MQSVVRHVLRNTYAQIGGGLLIALVIFLGGVLVGSGRVQLWPPQSQNGTLPAQLNYSSVNDVYKSLKANYDGKLTTAQLLDGLKEGLAQATNDPYTEYFNAKQAQDFSAELNNSFSGIGAELGKDSDGNLIIVSPITGFPAYKAGLKAQDIITDIDGQSTSGMLLGAAVDKIRGPKNTTVSLKVVRDHAQALSFAIRREDIKIPSVTHKVLPGNVGYLQISTFADDTASLARQAAKTFAQDKVGGVVLDLRGNPGGLLEAAVDVSSLWLPEGKTVVTERGTVGAITYSATGDNILHGIPTVVLIDGGSASASEITAGALHDTGAARLVGTKSYGKGVVQQLIHFGDGSELKVTVASWYRPNGQNIHKKGIAPDQTVDLTAADQTAGRDPQKDAALEWLAQR